MATLHRTRSQPRRTRTAPVPGTARAALAVRPFRIIWVASFASNVGTWMQNVALPAYAEVRWGSAAFVGALIFAQLGPLLLLSVVGGVLADRVSRRVWLISMQVVQLTFSLALAALVLGEPARLTLFLVALGVGVGNALNAPAWQASVPTLVGRENLAGAISLNSTMINGSRVVGPALAGVLLPLVGLAGVFVINAVTYLFVVVALLMVTFPPLTRLPAEGWRSLTLGFRVARAEPVIGRSLVTIAVFSFFSLVWVGQFATIANRNLGMDVKGLPYGLLYATFGLGAALGGLANGTVLARHDKGRLARWFLAAYTVALVAFALIRTPALAYPGVFMLGLVYFGFTTALLTTVQQHTDDAVRGRVMSLWMMAFGGTVPLGNLAFGPAIDAFGATPVLLMGAVVAALLTWWLDLRRAARPVEQPAVAAT